MASCCKPGADTVAQLDATPQGAAFQAFLRRLESWPALALSAVSLVASLLLKGRFPVDPAWISIALCGFPLLVGALEALLLEHRIRSSLLISIAMVSCIGIGQLFAAGEVAFIMALGGVLENATIRRARSGLRKLVSLVPQTARVVVTCPKCRARGELFRDVPVDKVVPGDSVLVKPGESIPIDGVVAEGSSSVDQSVMTGESLPVDKAVGDEVYSGTLNQFGALTVRATRVGEDGSLQRLVRMMREAETKKAPMQRIADKWAAILVPCALGIAIATYLVLRFAVGDADAALTRAVTVMVVFCPCALALATPTAIMAAIGQAAKHGVVIKGGEALERMGQVTVACLDKTGTLTDGSLSVAYGTDAETLALAAAVESRSEHPLAKAICAAVDKPAECADFHMTPGRGVKGVVGGRTVVCGTSAWLSENGIASESSVETEANRLRAEGKAVVFVGVDGAMRGCVALSDSVRPDAKDAVASLERTGVSVCLLTGDHAATAASVAAALGIRDVRPELLPKDKADAVAALEHSGRRCCMVGDGVNDAVALETAYVGIAMGGAGSDIAVEAADIALVGDDLSKLAYLKRLSTGCVRLIRTNIAISLVINFCAITCSILGLLGPVSGALVHNAGSVLVILNAALLYDRDYRDSSR